MAIASERLRQRIERDFADPRIAAEVVDLVGRAHESERVQAAVVVCAGGDLAGLHAARELAALDWRDVLMNAGLADGDWPARLTVELGPDR